MRAFALSILSVGCIGLLSISVGCEDASNPRATNTRTMPSSEIALDDGKEQEVAIPEFNTEAYDHVVENDFLSALENPKSTFSVDVDTASYSNIRRMIREDRVPPKGAARIEEMVNYFDYSYPEPDSEHPFSVTTELAKCPWKTEHQLVRIGLKGKTIESKERPAANLVFLLDVSGSMKDRNKLPLVKKAMKLLVKNLNGRDQIAIAVYAGSSGLVLPSTYCDQPKQIFQAIDQLVASGSTNGAEGIQLAYQIAQEGFIKDGINRVILCTDGDFNVGMSSQSELVDLIQEKAANDVFLSVLGFGTGNYKDSTMEKLADKGNGNYAYIDTMLEAQKALVEQMNGTLVTIAKDVKIQVDFNPGRIAAYRLIGYENRMLKNQDFKDDTKDAGEIGAGHTVTALYEVVPASADSRVLIDDDSDFVQTRLKPSAIDSDTMLTVNLRYKQPTGDTSQEFQVALEQSKKDDIPEASSDFQFASAVAGFGMLIRESKHKGETSWDWVIETARLNQGEDKDGFRAEFVNLARRAKLLCMN